MCSPLHSTDDLVTLRQEMNELRASLAAIQSNGHGPGSSFLAAAESNHATDRRKAAQRAARQRCIADGQPWKAGE